MAVSIAAVMRRVRNFFERESIEGVFAISGGVLEPAMDAPYIAISGSTWHDGVFPVGTLPETEHDETFHGKVWGLHPPSDFVSLCDAINNYDEKNPIGAYQSESFAGYSYNRGTVSSAGNGWEAAFAGQLLPYRRMFTEVDV